MFDLLANTLLSFRECFSREQPFRCFVLLILGFILRDEHLGVTSAIRALDISHFWYPRLLRFFRSDSVNTEKLRLFWYKTVKNSGLLIKKNGRCILIGDGVKEAKEGRRMPGSKKHHQESEDMSKPKYIYGYNFGAVDILVGNERQTFSLPLLKNIQDGLRDTSEWEGSKYSKESHIVQMITCGHKISQVVGKSYFLLDRYFLAGPGLVRLNALNASDPDKQLHIVTKTKSNCTAYENPPSRNEHTRGRRRLKGDSIKLNKLFDHPELFTESSAYMYGSIESVQYLCRDLLWGQQLYQKLRFVLVIRKSEKKTRKTNTEQQYERCILVSTDLSLSPEDIIELYACRFKIESEFREFKQQIGGFDFHFWTASLEKLNFFKKKNEPDPLTKVTDKDRRRKILEAAEAIERFVLLANIAMGLIQMMILNVNSTEEIEALRYLRTHTPGRVSESTMMYFLRHRFFWGLLQNPHSFVTQYIQYARDA